MPVPARPASTSPGLRDATMGAVALFIGLGLGRFAYSPMIPALVQAGWFSPPPLIIWARSIWWDT